MAPSVLHVAFLSHAHPVFDLGEDLFDGVQVGAVGRQEPESGAGGLDGGANGLGLVTSEIVHDDDVAGVQGLNELLFDIGQEAHPVDGAVEDARCRQPVAAQRRQERHGAPTAVRRIAPQTLIFRPPAPDRRHVGLDPGLVYEHQALGIKLGLQGLPAPTPARHIGPAPLKGEQGFF